MRRPGYLGSLEDFWGVSSNPRHNFNFGDDDDDQQEMAETAPKGVVTPQMARLGKIAAAIGLGLLFF